MFEKLLIANRGEIACRVIVTARRLGIATVAVYSEADRGARHVALADQAYGIGGSAPGDSYLRQDRIIDVARESGATAIHPGYGFLSENAKFAKACAKAKIIFVGPSPKAIESMGEKDVAKVLMEAAGVPVVPGYHGKDQRPARLAREAKSLGYPVLIKAAAGGGGKGVRRVEAASAFLDALESARRESQNAFGSNNVLIEAYIARPRHVEVQVFGDSQGQVVHLFERDCSMQRRYQKVIEEAPAPDLPETTRQRLGEAAVAAAQAIGYVGAGTVEFLLDPSGGTADPKFYFMEMNTRLQVEHPVTEAITGVDLVEWQLRIAAGEPLPRRQSELSMTGHAIEVRLYAEDPSREFLPSIGRLQRLELPENLSRVRVDSGVRQGDSVSIHYDPMIAKVIAHGVDRKRTLEILRRALSETAVLGVRTNLGFLTRLLNQPDFAAGSVDTHLVERHAEKLLSPDNDARCRLLAMAFLSVILRSAPQAKHPGADRFSPWRTLAGWRHGGERRSQVSLTIDGQEVSFGVSPTTHDGFELEIDGIGAASIAGAELRDGDAYALVDGRAAIAQTIERSDHIDVLVGGDGLTISLAGKASGAGALEGDGAGYIVAPLPGRVAVLSVTKGDKVKKGTALIVLEAMKMEHTLVAPRAGKVEDVLCKVGQMVDEGATLVTLSS